MRTRLKTKASSCVRGVEHEAGQEKERGQAGGGPPKTSTSLCRWRWQPVGGGGLGFQEDASDIRGENIPANRQK